MNIGNIELDISTNDGNLENDIRSPSSHSLHTNWRYSSQSNTGISASLVLHNTQRSTEVILTPSSLEVIGDIDYITQNPLFNPQFLSTGNKGIVSKFISHTCELSGIISLHACALYNPITGEIKIGIGTSGSGKTALISSGVEAGLLIIGTEMLQISEDGKILLGNTYDVIGQHAASFFQERNEFNVEVFGDDKIFDQTGSKCLADFSRYRVAEGIDLNIRDAEIVFLQFGDDNFKDGYPITDDDMSLRFIGYSASEKIEAPTYLGYDLVDTPMYGNIGLRNKVIHMLNTKVSSRIILGGSMDSFRNFLQE